MNSLLTDVPLNAPSDDIPAAVTSLIDAAMAAFDADRDVSRLYLSRASAILRMSRRTVSGAGRSRRKEPRGGLMTWQLNRLVDYIETHLAKKMTAKELSGLINLSYGQMCRAFKISVGVAPFQYITRRRIELACALMKTAEGPLSQIALACGLCDQSHFCRVFRRITGMSPSAWCRSALSSCPAGSRVMRATDAAAGERHRTQTRYSAP